MKLMKLLRKYYIILLFTVMFVLIMILFIRNASFQKKIANYEKDNSRLTEDITKTLENYQTLKIEIDELKQTIKK